jgi:hypothetical protein
MEPGFSVRCKAWEGGFSFMRIKGPVRWRQVWVWFPCEAWVWYDIICCLGCVHDLCVHKIPESYVIVIGIMYTNVRWYTYKATVVRKPIKKYTHVAYKESYTSRFIGKRININFTILNFNLFYLDGIILCPLLWIFFIKVIFNSIILKPYFNTWKPFNGFFIQIFIFI